MKILASRRFPGPAWDELDGVEYLDGLLADTPPRDDVEVLAIVAERVDDSTLARFPNVVLVTNYGVGYDSIDVAAAAERNVVVTNTPGVLDAATADLAFALILAVRRRLVVADRAIRERRWNGGWVDPDFLGHDVSGATLGIVGLGRIGSAVARRGEAFDMQVVHHSRGRDRPGRLELDELLGRADVVSLHVPLSPETRNLLDARRLALLRDGACLVNTARGEVVDEEALVEELVSGRINAGLDVFAHEPNVPEQLLDLPNVVLTPHVGSATAETRAAMTRVVVDNIQAVEAGLTPPNAVT
jgi:glyoxylate reductase